FTVTGGAHSISFLGQTAEDSTAFIDHVSLQAQSVDIGDPGFETPNVGTGSWDAFQYDPSGSAWTFNSGSGVAGNGSGFTSGNPDAPDGSQVAFVQSSASSFSQSVTLGPGTYSINFLAAQRGNYQPGGEQS